MKRIITKILLSVCIVGFIISILLDLGIHTYYDVNKFKRTSSDYFQQITTVLKENDKDIEILKADFNRICIMRAHIVAHITQQNPDMIQNMDECKKVAALIDVDEIHFLNQEGVIFAGTHPEYYDYSVEMGGQIGFFKPMILDKSLELCQEMMENTAKNKKMQYAAVWLEDGSAIVQIGMEPKRLLQALDGNRISDMFNLISTDSTSTFYAVDTKTNIILASTRQSHNGKKAKDIGIDISKLGENKFYEYQKIDGKMHYVAAKKYKNMVLVRTKLQSDLIKSVFVNAFWFCVYITMILVLMLIAIYYFLDKKIIQSILNINKQLKLIEQGNYNIDLKDDSVKEFSELCSSINSMTKNLLNFTNKISKALELSEVPIGICEIDTKNKQFVATSRVQTILKLSNKQYQELKDLLDVYTEKRDIWLQDRSDLGNYIFSLVQYPECFIRYQEFVFDDNQLAVMIDVTDQIREKKELAVERDTDELTGLYNRRAFYRLLESIKMKPESRKNAVIILVDLDHLKKVNDLYGHLNGNRYIMAFSEILHLYNDNMKIAARMGGDEFLFVVYGLEEQQEGEAIVQWIKDNRDIKKVSLENGEEIVLEYSVGYAYYKQEDHDYQGLINQADKLMYEDKNKRKNNRK